jgi:hypothetical protein
MISSSSRVLLRGPFGGQHQGGPDLLLLVLVLQHLAHLEGRDLFGRGIGDARRTAQCGVDDAEFEMAVRVVLHSFQHLPHLCFEVFQPRGHAPRVSGEIGDGDLAVQLAEKGDSLGGEGGGCGAAQVEFPVVAARQPAPLQGDEQ